MVAWGEKPSVNLLAPTIDPPSCLLPTPQAPHPLVHSLAILLSLSSTENFLMNGNKREPPLSLVFNSAVNHQQPGIQTIF